MEIEKEIEQISKENEELQRSIIFTVDDEVAIRNIRAEFELEVEKAVKETIQRVKLHYMKSELDYIKASHNL